MRPFLIGGDTLTYYDLSDPAFKKALDAWIEGTPPDTCLCDGEGCAECMNEDGDDCE